MEYKKVSSFNNQSNEIYCNSYKQQLTKKNVKIPYQSQSLFFKNTRKAKYNQSLIYFQNVKVRPCHVNQTHTKTRETQTNLLIK